MKTVKIFFGLFSILVLLTLSACDKTKVVLIRIQNDTGHDITEIFVSGPVEDHEYGDLKTGEKSNYQVYEKAYRYAYCTFKIGDAQFTVQPIDFVGESLLEPGEYTYRLMITDLDTPWAWMELK